MAQRYEIKAQGLSGVRYRIEIYDATYGGSTVTTLDGDQQFVRFGGGQRERVGVKPLWGKDARINVITNEDLSPLFDLRDRDGEVRIYDDGSGQLVWKGYLLPDFFTDEPLTDLPGVGLRASDGLPTLEANTVNDLTGISSSDIGDDSTFISYRAFFTKALNQLFSTSLPTEHAVEW